MSSNSTNGVYDINVRLTYALHCIDKGNSAAKEFCAVMNVPPPPAKFQRYNGILLESLTKVSNASVKKAGQETVDMNNSNRESLQHLMVVVRNEAIHL
ncbi:hypothetical protein TNIN_139241 [Trichonephila inaurata madagascariensis]|uniref:Mutator-like transposase domain-containing protein n=1 Tax=Trichonephila inaurata madagascariensis TaxID=2747483 RepID=A0A8X7BU82_9ARAC|nr:hypothetical protein TNIN_139241 [Trichonephila inaurata madagascariensis]